jgi:hypothetical protein
MRSEGIWKYIRISAKHLTYQSRLSNRYFDAAIDVDDSNLDRKNGHGGWPIDAIGLDMQAPKKSLELASGSTYFADLFR